MGRAGSDSTEALHSFFTQGTGLWGEQVSVVLVLCTVLALKAEEGRCWRTGHPTA